jgi:hypothetical protein
MRARAVGQGWRCWIRAHQVVGARDAAQRQVLGQDGRVGVWRAVVGSICRRHRALPRLHQRRRAHSAEERRPGLPHDGRRLGAADHQADDGRLLAREPQETAHLQYHRTPVQQTLTTSHPATHALTRSIAQFPSIKYTTNHGSVDLSRVDRNNFRHTVDGH